MSLELKTFAPVRLVVVKAKNGSDGAPNAFRKLRELTGESAIEYGVLFPSDGETSEQYYAGQVLNWRNAKLLHESGASKGSLIQVLEIPMQECIEGRIMDWKGKSMPAIIGPTFESLAWIAMAEQRAIDPNAPLVEIYGENHLFLHLPLQNPTTTK